MKIKLDENLPESLLPALRALGHDADNVRSEGIEGQDDDAMGSPASGGDFGVEAAMACGSLQCMTAPLDQIHRDPAILDRAIESRESLDIVSDGRVAATLTPRAAVAIEEARREMEVRFSAPNWSFAVGAPMNRDERNARG